MDTVEQADGYDVTRTTELLEQASATKLFFVNLGGYDPTEFGELPQYSARRIGCQGSNQESPPANQKLETPTQGQRV
ncbi:hypothetical protein [Rhizobium rhododendri]|uniref:Uncharacterized protein n=1 Tax=Rhizobium rhododendri TaxID=2506430 RepID=A0ABY8IRU4_9HYPH|nr:hypothetical protein [Rhizobium rhododendri]WFS26190.1 hypothetical protein PR018_26300 [Rhizobium rhododendri]